MRDNAKGGALTEVTFYILLSLYAPKHGYAVMQFVEEKNGRAAFVRSRHFIWSIEFFAGQEVD